MDRISPLKIGDTITIYPEFDEVQLLENGQNKSIKLEPRVMKVMLLLSENNGAVVTRDHFLEEIWDNYEGADEALTQSISLLRKSINDTEKQNRIIETISKKGYKLNRPVKQIEKSTKGFESKSSTWQIHFSLKTGLISGLIILILLYITFMVLNSVNNKESIAPLAPQTEQTNQR